jgi:hypothetical protein
MKMRYDSVARSCEEYGDAFPDVGKVYIVPPKTRKNTAVETQSTDNESEAEPLVDGLIYTSVLVVRVDPCVTLVAGRRFNAYS